MQCQFWQADYAAYVMVMGRGAGVSRCIQAKSGWCCPVWPGNGGPVKPALAGEMEIWGLVIFAVIAAIILFIK
ncbi:hypothetical protein [Thalassospira sp. TSL5-1]|uniref:hypothetical protein n=1 Tax=Thalassospira sp. TSL5-1 TaxID=1544451 RepID=UPI00093E74EC|nr:hypothetical protein [Thalassospira sp. TSL5-1]OKH88443.1 hypothetical protein LF95_17745 [Thalassospira sp. TSL5-1]